MRDKRKIKLKEYLIIDEKNKIKKYKVKRMLDFLEKNPNGICLKELYENCMVSKTDGKRILNFLIKENVVDFKFVIIKIKKKNSNYLYPYKTIKYFLKQK
jgi:hypothetical protein